MHDHVLILSGVCTASTQTDKLFTKSLCPGIGLLVPDIPLEETGEIRDAATQAGLELVLLTTPTTPRERMQAIAKASQGFVYLVSVTGNVIELAPQCSIVCVHPW